MKVNDTIITTESVHRICGYVDKDVEGIIKAIDESAHFGKVYWIKFPGHSRTMKLFIDEFKLKEK